MVQKIMEKESALNVLEDIKNKIGGVDLDEICGEKAEIKENTEGGEDVIYKRLVQGIMCGLVYWDEDKQCLVQELISPVKSGEIECDKLYYKNKLTLRDGKDFKAKNQVGLTVESLSVCCGRPVQIIEKIHGTDVNIAMGCLSFFDK